jgi:hypothetical protein
VGAQLANQPGPGQPAAGQTAGGQAVAARPVIRLPVGGPILETDYVNPAPKVRDHRPNWPSNVVGGKTFLTLGSHRYDWVSIIDPDSEYEQPAVGLSGTVIGPRTSGSDNPLLHPFLNDYEFHVAPDQRYLELLAPKMTDRAYIDSTAVANTKFGLNVPGVIGMECDGRLVPAEFQAKEGDRVALFGRWIVDTGHADFHTEIHPPLLMATARPSRSAQQGGSRAGKNDATTVRIISRPYLVSQEFGDGGLLEHLLKELGKVMHPVIPLSLQVQAHPRLLDIPFRGFHILTFKVRPPTPRADRRDTLMVEFTFTRRDDSIAVQLLRGNDNESLRVVIVFNEIGYVPPPKPKATEYTITLKELEAMDSTAGNIYRGTIFAGILASPLAPVILNRGIKSTKYAAPKAPVLGPVTRTTLGHLAQQNQPIDASQPYPLFGTVKLEWQRFGVTGEPGPVLGGG